MPGKRVDEPRQNPKDNSLNRHGPDGKHQAACTEGDEIDQQNKH
jgi:hypothetical protein